MSEIHLDRLRKVMTLANQEAQRFCHEYIGTEHIFLALLKEGSSCGATILKNYSFDLKNLRLEIEKTMKSGPDMVTIGKIPQTPRAKLVMDYSIEYARKIGDNYLGTEHLLYGIVKENEGIVSQILRSRGLNEDKVKKGVEDLLGVSEKKEEVEYWYITQKDMDLKEFLERNYDYEFAGEMSEEGCNILKQNPKSEVDSNFVIGRIKPKKVKIFYNANNKQQIEFALNLRDIFDMNKVVYLEQPPISEVIKTLEKPIKETSSLIKRLEKKV